MTIKTTAAALAPGMTHPRPGRDRMTARHAARRPNYTARRILAILLGATAAGVLGAISGAAVAAVTAL